MLPGEYGWYSPDGSQFSTQQPPQYVLDQLGGSYDQSRYYWNPDTFSLVDRYNGGSYSYDRADPANGTQVVLPYGYQGGDLGYGGGGENIGTPYSGFGTTYQFAPGQSPYIGFPDGGGIFASSDPNAIDAYQHDAQTRDLQGVAKVGALVGGAALGNYLTQPGAPTTGAGNATVSGSYANAGAAPAAGGQDMAAVLGGSQAGQDMAAVIAGSGAGAGAGAALGGLGLGGWLTVGALGAQALQGNKPIETTNAPPAYIAPYLSDAAGQAANLYQQGNYVAPVTQAGIDYGTNVLNGNYLNSNPWLDATFNKAAGAVTNQVQSNFGLAGRNARGIDAAGFAQEGYNDLATQIYGGNYQAERQRQQQIVPYAGQLGTYTNPGTGLDDYINRLRGLSGGYGTQTTPTQSNWLSGLAGLGLALMDRP